LLEGGVGGGGKRKIGFYMFFEARRRKKDEEKIRMLPRRKAIFWPCSFKLVSIQPRGPKESK